jgi:hypothetical protein
MKHVNLGVRMLRRALGGRVDETVQNPRAASWLVVWKLDRPPLEMSR